MRRNESGLTVIEILLILMLFSLLVSATIPFLFYKDDIKLSPAALKEEQNILLIKNALHFYYLDNGFYPETKQGLDALVARPHSPPKPKHWVPYMKEIPVDQWGRSYEYINYDNARDIEIFSCGPPRALQNWWYRITHSLNPHVQYCKKKELINKKLQNSQKGFDL